jgi:hypothetical protein
MTMPKKQINQHRIYTNPRVRGGLILNLIKDRDDVMAQLKTAGISSTSTAEGYIEVVNVDVDTVIGALEFDNEPYKINKQNDGSVLIIELLN